MKDFTAIIFSCYFILSSNITPRYPLYWSVSRNISECFNIVSSKVADENHGIICKRLHISYYIMFLPSNLSVTRSPVDLKTSKNSQKKLTKKIVDLISLSALTLTAPSRGGLMCDVITIVAMFTIVEINHNCRNTNHDCCKKPQLLQLQQQLS